MTSRRWTKNISFLLLILLIIFCAHHLVIYVHEWIHGTAAWIGGYKLHPFDIDYGKHWVTLIGIDEMVDYRQLMAEGNNSLAAAIAIMPTLFGMLFFLLGLWLLNKFPKVQKLKWLFSFCYWFTVFELAEVYAYIPIRTFSKHGDIHNFLQALDLSPWIVFVPGTLFVVMGIYYMLSWEVPRACNFLNIHSRKGHFFFLFATVFFILGYFGGVGFLQTDKSAHLFSWISWMLIPICLIAFSRKAPL